MRTRQLRDVGASLSTLGRPWQVPTIGGSLRCLPERVRRLVGDDGRHERNPGKLQPLPRELDPSPRGSSRPRPLDGATTRACTCVTWRARPQLSGTGRRSGGAPNLRSIASRQGRASSYPSSARCAFPLRARGRPACRPRARTERRRRAASRPAANATRGGASSPSAPPSTPRPRGSAGNTRRSSPCPAGSGTWEEQGGRSPVQAGFAGERPASSWAMRSSTVAVNRAIACSA